MNQDKLKELSIDPQARRRPQSTAWWIFLIVVIAAGAALYFGVPRASDVHRSTIGQAAATGSTAASTNSTAAAIGSNSPAQTSATAPKGTGNVLTVSGYIVNRERIELSPRFMGVVKWIGVKKGDSVTNGQVLVLLDDAEYTARLQEVDGRLAGAKAALEKAQLDFQRATQLTQAKVESQQLEDDMRVKLASAKASIQEIEGSKQIIQTYLDWCIIRSPINGVIMEKLVDPNELVVPQSFGGTRGPSTALVSLADLKDLQVEVELNEADVAKVGLNQPCRVVPEAFPDHSYAGYVAKMAPEANRQKGTLQIKVQIRNPDRFLTPELSARVDFLSTNAPAEGILESAK